MTLLRNGPTPKDGSSDDKESMLTIQSSAHDQNRGRARVFMQAAEEGYRFRISRPIKYFSAPTLIMGLDDNTRFIQKFVV